MRGSRPLAGSKEEATLTFYIKHEGDECGLVYETDDPLWIATIEASRESTYDCPGCGKCCILQYEYTDRIVLGRTLDHYLNEKDPSWPRDGRDTHIVELGEEQRAQYFYENRKEIHEASTEHKPL